MTGQEARDDERDPTERLIEYVANVLRDRKYGHDIEWVRGNLHPNHLRTLAAGYRKHPEPEWEYGAGYEADNGREVLWFSLGGGAFTVREAAENEVTRYDDPQIRLIRRTRPGPWVPVGEGEQ